VERDRGTGGIEKKLNRRRERKSGTTSEKERRLTSRVVE